MDCLFCAIVAGDIPATLVFSDDEIVAFEDINPVAPTHLVVVPRAHFENAAELAAADPQLAGRLVAVMGQLGKDTGSAGFRMVFNTGPAAGQSVQHVHGHVLAGRAFSWPPG